MLEKIFDVHTINKVLIDWIHIGLLQITTKNKSMGKCEKKKTEGKIWTLHNVIQIIRKWQITHLRYRVKQSKVNWNAHNRMFKIFKKDSHNCCWKSRNTSIPHRRWEPILVKILSENSGNTY